MSFRVSTQPDRPSAALPPAPPPQTAPSVSRIAEDAIAAASAPMITLSANSPKTIDLGIITIHCVQYRMIAHNWLNDSIADDEKAALRDLLQKQLGECEESLDKAKVQFTKQGLRVVAEDNKLITARTNDLAQEISQNVKRGCPFLELRREMNTIQIQPPQKFEWGWNNCYWASILSAYLTNPVLHFKQPLNNKEQLIDLLQDSKALITKVQNEEFLSAEEVLRALRPSFQGGLFIQANATEQLLSQIKRAVDTQLPSYIDVDIAVDSAPDKYPYPPLTFTQNKTYVLQGVILSKPGHIISVVRKPDENGILHTFVCDNHYQAGDAVTVEISNDEYRTLINTGSLQKDNFQFGSGYKATQALYVDEQEEEFHDVRN